MEQVYNEQFFENLRGLVRPEEFAKLTGFSVQTVYNWNYRTRATSRIPKELFVKVRGKLFIRADVFKNWISLENPTLDWSDF